jgi:vitamin B12 transporter
MRMLSFLCSVPLFTLAAEPASEAIALPNSREEIVVSAARVPIPVALAGGGVTVITRAEIARRNPQYVSELLRDVPGVAVSRNGGAGAQTQVRVRGAEGNHLLVLIDGVEANDFSQNDEFDFAHLTVSDVERIEIVRGPQSALWGSDALAGVMNIITRNSQRPFEITGEAEYGSFGTEHGALAVGGARGTLRGRLGLSYVDAGGFNVSSRGTEEDGYRNAALNLKLGWQPLEILKFDLNGRAIDAENEFDTPDFSTDGLNRDVAATIDVVQGYVGGRAELATFDQHWIHSVSATWTKLGNLTRDPTDAGERRTEGRKYALDYQSNWRLDTDWMAPLAHSFTLAVDYDLEEFTQRGPIVFGADPNQDRRRHTLGYVVEYRTTLAEFTSLGVSGRWDDNSDFADVGTYRVTLTHEVMQTNTLLSAAYGTGQKAPTFSERYGFFSNGGLPFIGNASLQPERSRGYEFGVRQFLRERRFSVGATYFNEHLTDEIDGFVFEPVSGSFTANNRAGTSKRDGVEVSAQAAVTPSLGFNGSYTYLDATEQGPGARRLDEVRRPRHSGALSANWRGFDRRLTLDAHFTHSGTRSDLTFLPPLFAGRTTLSAYTLAGLSAAYQVTKVVAVTARIENLFDDEYQEVFDFQTEGVGGFVGLKCAFEP